MFRDPISAVTVCVGYGDFLRESVKWDRHHFDKWVVVTSPTDEETREVCRANHLTCLVTEDGARDGEFSKGRLIERGLQQLPADSWVVHKDADTVLPARFRHLLDVAHLRPECIYGCDRYMVKSWEKWQALVAAGWVHSALLGHPHSVGAPYGLEVGCRWVGPDGYVPIGFFQMWHRTSGTEEWKGTRVRPYPLSHGSACRTDVQFALQWDRRDRLLIPELFVAHLESEPAPVGANWKGRTTKRFGPEHKTVGKAVS